MTEYDPDDERRHDDDVAKAANVVDGNIQTRWKRKNLEGDKCWLSKYTHKKYKIQNTKITNAGCRNTQKNTKYKSYKCRLLKYLWQSSFPPAWREQNLSNKNISNRTMYSLTIRSTFSVDNVMASYVLTTDQNVNKQQGE